MSNKRSDQFLDAGHSDDDDQSQGYDSEADQMQKGGRVAKRRKLEDFETAEDEEEEEALPTTLTGDGDDEDGIGCEEGGTKDRDSATRRVLKRKNLVASDEAIKRSGVVYLSRIPPFMKPRKLRSLLEPYGELNRIYMAEEDASARKKRVKGGGNRRRLYLEGWVEFVKKKDAKRVCELLNGRNIGGKKRAYYYDSMWTLLYLKGFKWHHLTDQIAAENAARESRMRAEISKAQRENREYLANIQKAKMLDHMEAKAGARKTKDSRFVPEDQDGTVPHTAPASNAYAKVHKDQGARRFSQKAVAVKARRNDADQPDRVARVLSAIF